jgi:hypothetical protein
VWHFTAPNFTKLTPVDCRYVLVSYVEFQLDWLRNVEIKVRISFTYLNLTPCADFHEARPLAFTLNFMKIRQSVWLLMLGRRRTDNPAWSPRKAFMYSLLREERQIAGGC